MEQDTEWKGKYKSELLMVCHMDAQAMHEVEAISDKEMREYDRACLVSKTKKTSATVHPAPAPATVVYAHPR